MAGRPRAFATVEELQQGIDDYIATAFADDEPLSVSGLAAHLEVDRATLLRYGGGEYEQEYCDPVKKVVQKIEAQHVSGLLKGKLNATGCIFTLKNNHGWRDQQHIEQNSNVAHSIDEQTSEQVAKNVLELLNAARG